MDAPALPKASVFATIFGEEDSTVPVHNLVGFSPAACRLFAPSVNQALEARPPLPDCPLLEVYEVAQQLPLIAELLMRSDPSLAAMASIATFAAVCTAFRTAAFEVPSMQLAEYKGDYVGSGTDPHDEPDPESRCSIVVSHVKGQLVPRVEATFNVSRAVSQTVDDQPGDRWTLSWSQFLDPVDVARQFYKPTGWKHAARFSEWLSRNPDKEVPPYSMSLDPARAIGDAQRDAEFQAVNLTRKTPLRMRLFHEPANGSPPYMAELTACMLANAHCHVMNSLDGEEIAPAKTRKNPEPEAVPRVFFIDDLEFGLGGAVTWATWQDDSFRRAVGEMGLVGADGQLQLIWRMLPAVRKLAGYDVNDAAAIKKMLAPPKRKQSRGWAVVTDDDEGDDDSDDDDTPGPCGRKKRKAARAAEASIAANCAELAAPERKGTTGPECYLPARRTSPPSVPSALPDSALAGLQRWQRQEEQKQKEKHRQSTGPRREGEAGSSSSHARAGPVPPFPSNGGLVFGIGPTLDEIPSSDDEDDEDDFIVGDGPGSGDESEDESDEEAYAAPRPVARGKSTKSTGWRSTCKRDGCSKPMRGLKDGLVGGFCTATCRTVHFESNGLAVPEYRQSFPMRRQSSAAPEEEEDLVSEPPDADEYEVEGGGSPAAPMDLTGDSDDDDEFPSESSPAPTGRSRRTLD